MGRMEDGEGDELIMDASGMPDDPARVERWVQFELWDVQALAKRRLYEDFRREVSALFAKQCLSDEALDNSSNPLHAYFMKYVLDSQLLGKLPYLMMKEKTERECEEARAEYRNMNRRKSRRGLEHRLHDGRSARR